MVLVSNRATAVFLIPAILLFHHLLYLFIRKFIRCCVECEERFLHIQVYIIQKVLLTSRVLDQEIWVSNAKDQLGGSKEFYRKCITFEIYSSTYLYTFEGTSQRVEKPRWLELVSSLLASLSFKPGLVFSQYSSGTLDHVLFPHSFFMKLLSNML